MKLEETYRVERTKWDALARRDRAPASLRSQETFQDYARRSSTMAGVAEFLGDLRGLRVLEYGCGLGEISTLLARSGARVTGFDLSAASVAVARERAERNELGDRLALAVAAGESLPFADESFDVVFGKAILHHLNVHAGWRDLHRVLRTGGKGVFIEPMGMNPLLRFARACVPYPGKNPRGADRPLNYDEIHGWGRAFRHFEFREMQLLSMLERALGFRKRLTPLRRIDDRLLEHLPFLRRYCRYVVMFMVK